MTLGFQWDAVVAARATSASGPLVATVGNHCFPVVISGCDFSAAFLVMDSSCPFLGCHAMNA